MRAVRADPGFMRTELGWRLQVRPLVGLKTGLPLLRRVIGKQSSPNCEVGADSALAGCYAGCAWGCAQISRFCGRWQEGARVLFRRPWS
jgi:hypothetical protein